MQILYGPVAQLGERTVRIRKAEGSIPFGSTKRCKSEFGGFGFCVHHSTRPGLDAICVPGPNFSFAFPPAFIADNFLSTFPSGKLPQPIRALHFCGERTFMPAFIADIFFINTSQRQTAAANTRTSLLWRAYFYARV